MLDTALLCHPSAQTLGSSFPYNLIKNVYFLATFILINSVCLLTIKIPGSQCLGTGMTKKGDTRMTRKEHWDDIVYYVISCHITMFVQLCINYFCGTVCYSIFMLVLLKIILF
ncbi:MAG: hypothetical protein O7149_05145 [Wolbachia endosymbiont of Hylaeus sinuatus]|nr:hypothetical protein [Wolbachia endosymbiont of Hylaeus sinuatus]